MLEYIAIAIIAIILAPVVIDSVIDDYKWLRFNKHSHDDDDNIIG